MPVGGVSKRPSMLLLAEHGLVPIVAATEELRHLRDWRDTDRRFSLALVTGPRGSGKTRLAAELCHGAGSQWQAGFADFSLESPYAELDNERPALIVGDRADLRAAEVGGLMRDVVRRGAETPKVRLLLLATDAYAWWLQLNVLTDSLASRLTTVQLSLPLAVHASRRNRERIDHYQAARTAFGRRDDLEGKRPAPTPLGLAGEARRLGSKIFHTPLAIHFEALSNTLPRSQADGRQSGWQRARTAPAVRVLDDERGRWRTSAPESDVDVIESAVAVPSAWRKTIRSLPAVLLPVVASSVGRLVASDGVRLA